MKYKILLSLLVVSVLGCGVTDAENKQAEMLKNLPKNWQNGIPFDMDAFVKAAKNVKNKRAFKEIMGRGPTATDNDRNEWRFKGKFVDEITRHQWDELVVLFSPFNEHVAHVVFFK